MMKRFSRRRRSGRDKKEKSSIDASDWLPKLLEQGIVEAKSLENWSEPGIPASVAAIGRGERVDGTVLIVAFSPKSATDALLAGLSAANFRGGADAKPDDKAAFSGQLLVIAPQWDSGARRLLAMLGRAPYALEAVSAPSLGSARTPIQPEPAPRVLAASAGQLAARLPAAELRAAFRRAALALEGLAAKHGGAVRVGLDRIELVVTARRVAEIRISDGAAFFETQIGGRTTTPLSGSDLAGALDALEGQIRRRLNDRKVREGEEGLRGRVIAQLIDGAELRALCRWPMPGADLDVIDGVGLNDDGEPVVVAVREEIGWSSLALILEEMGPLAALLPTLFANNAPPLRLSAPRLLLAAERFADGIERALAALTVAYELRKVSGAAGSSVDLVASGSGEGAQERAPRRGRRRGGRGRTSGGNGGSGVEEAGDANGPPSGPAADSADGSEVAPRRRAPRKAESDSRSNEDDPTDGDDGGRGRGRRGRRSRRGGRGTGADDSGSRPQERSARASEDSRNGNAKSRRAPRFEEVSLMDLDDAEKSAGRPRGPDDEDPDGSDDDRSGGRDRGRRPGRRGRRGGRGDSGRGSGTGDGAESSARADAPLAMDSPDEVEAEAVAEEDLVDADDLSEILARLADDSPDFETSDSNDESYEDAEEIDEDDAQSARRRDRDSRRRSETDEAEEGPRISRGRAAILVHGDRDSLLSAVLLARDIRQLEGLWVYPQEELMTFFRSVATDLREDMSIYVVGFSPSPARDVVQASALYRGRLHWFDRHAWPPEDLVALRESLGTDAVHGGVGIDSTLPLVLETCTRRSRFSDKLVDLVTGRFTQHDFERWGRLWSFRVGQIAAKTGDIRGDIADLLAGRPSDLAKEAALIELPPAPNEVAWVAGKDFRLVHFGGHVMVIVDVDEDLDVQLCARIARERYSASLSLAHRVGEGSFVFAGDEVGGKRALDYLAVADHLVNKLEWVDARSDGDHVSRFHVRELERYPDRQEEVVGEIAMGRSLLER